jgi:CheY-like chemotaxis protein
VNLGCMYCFGSATGFTGLKPQIGDPNLRWLELSDILATRGGTLSALLKILSREPRLAQHALHALKEFRLVRILVVDDNPAVRSYLRSILEQQESWQVCDEARTGAEAIQRVQNAPPDVILLDFQMPDLNGLDVAQQISQLFPQIPILMVTIHLSSQLTEAARKAGFRGACAKQDVGSIVQAVDVLLNRGTYFPAMSSGD